MFTKRTTSNHFYSSQISSPSPSTSANNLHSCFAQKLETIPSKVFSTSEFLPIFSFHYLHTKDPSRHFPSPKSKPLFMISHYSLPIFSGNFFINVLSFSCFHLWSFSYFWHFSLLSKNLWEAESVLTPLSLDMGRMFLHWRMDHHHHLQQPTTHTQPGQDCPTNKLGKVWRVGTLSGQRISRFYAALRKQRG